MERQGEHGGEKGDRGLYSLIMLIISLIYGFFLVSPCTWGVLRVLTEQTLEINSVVKDPTQPGPSLVTEVKYSSLTILHQFHPSYRWILQQFQAQRER